MTNVNGTRSADMFLTRALEKILADKELKKSTGTQLKKQCELALNDLKREAKTNNSQYVQVNDIEKYFVPFELACKSKSPKVVEIALDSIQVKTKRSFLAYLLGKSPMNLSTKRLSPEININ
jgi:brefeldin A-inhibited guanine nucleotide-exchange protein